MWLENDVIEHTKQCVDKDFYVNPSAVVLKSNYVADTGWRFDRMRSLVEHTIQVYKQELKNK